MIRAGCAGLIKKSPLMKNIFAAERQLRRPLFIRGIKFSDNSQSPLSAFTILSLAALTEGRNPPIKPMMSANIIDEMII